MAFSKTLLKISNIIFPFSDFLYLLQQEEYSLQRFWFWFPRFFLKRNFQKRDRLVYTARLKITLVFSIILFFILEIAVLAYSKQVLLYSIALVVCIPIITVLANTILSPLYLIGKQYIIRTAQKKFYKMRTNTRVIGIAGSYGKTTTKHFVEQFVKIFYKTQVVPGNINSTIGIAYWLLQHFQKETQVLIVEMDAYRLGRIAQSTQLVQPDIAIITNIGDQHLQRFKSKKKLAQSIHELFAYTPQNAFRITNAATFEYLKQQEFDLEVPIIASGIPSAPSNFHKDNIAYAVTVAKILDIPEKYYPDIIKNLSLPDRRQKLTNLFGFDGIDDSYNISYDTALSGITRAAEQARKINKKLLVITAGIPEVGPQELHNNRALGKLLDAHADQILILKSIFANEITQGITHTDKLHLLKNISAAIHYLQSNFQPEEYFVLLQPELPDIYY